MAMKNAAKRSRAKSLASLWSRLMGLRVKIVKREMEIFDGMMVNDTLPGTKKILKEAQQKKFELFVELEEVTRELCNLIGDDRNLQDAVLRVNESLKGMWRWEPKSNDELRESVSDSGPFRRKFFEAADLVDIAILRAEVFLFPTGGQSGNEQFVNLGQMAALVSRSKRTLEGWVKKVPPPDPDHEGGGGKPHEWKWTRIRQWLEERSGRTFSERFPDLRFAR